MIHRKLDFSWSAGKQGFTLIEIMLAVAILSFGIISIYQGLFVSLDAFGYYVSFQDIAEWYNERIWAIENQLMMEQVISLGTSQGRIQIEGNEYDWQQTVTSVDAQKGLYRVELSISWREGRRRITVPRGAYVINIAQAAASEGGQ